MKKKECNGRTLKEEDLKSAFVEALHKLQDGKTDYLEILQKNIESVISGENEDSPEDIESRLKDLQQEIINKATRHEDYSALADEIFILKEKKEKLMADGASRNQNMKRVNELRDFISKHSPGKLDFDETLVNHLLEKVTVFDDYMEFEFKSGVMVVMDT